MAAHSSPAGSPCVQALPVTCPPLVERTFVGGCRLTGAAVRVRARSFRRVPSGWLDEAAARLGLDLGTLRRFWQASGLSDGAS